ncbi:MAG: TraB/GumN family protein [Proteobacteria bacterium]|nr:TraB/GumN family protein [Pseudomonadota bacterium]
MGLILTSRRVGVWTAFGTALALLLSSCASEPHPVTTQPQALASVADVARPPFYRIDGGRGATILLMGTIHIGPIEGWEFSEALRDGLERADSFVLEVDLDQISEDAVGTLLSNLVVIQSGRENDDFVNPETAKLLAENDELRATMGLPANARGRLKPWYIAMILIESATQRSGLSSKSAAESVIRAAHADRPVLALVTFDEQLRMLDEIDPRLQDLMLRDTVGRIDNTVEEILALAEAWKNGNENFLEGLTRKGIDEMPEFERFHAIILGDRNRRWLATFRLLLDDPDRADEVVFVAVGAVHLVAEAGLIDLFERTGYRVAVIDHETRVEAYKP